MKLKQAILQVMGRDLLKEIVDGLEIDDVDRRSAQDMRYRLSRVRRATPTLLLDSLSEAEVKQVCDAIGIDGTGRRRVLVDRLLASERNSRSSRSPRLSESTATTEQTGTASVGAREITLLRGLLERLDADASSERPMFRGVVSDSEREALRALVSEPIEAVQQTPQPSDPPPIDDEDDRPPAPEPVQPHTIDETVLRYERSPKPDWVLCLDFGTAKSKACAATGGDELIEPDLIEIPLGTADEDDLDNSIFTVSSSVCIDDDGRMFAGSEAIKRSRRYGGSDEDVPRTRLDSLKQEISQTDPAGFENLYLSPAENPTQTSLTYEDAFTFFLAYLTDLATTHLEALTGTRYVRRRFTLPWWNDDQRQWAADLVARLLARAQLVADTFRGGWRDGIPVSEVKDVLRHASVHDDRLSWLVDRSTEDDATPMAKQGGLLEAVAAASGRVWKDRDARELMLVVDVGAGTTDLSLFLVVQDHRGRRAFPVAPCGACIRQAGEALDSFLEEELLRRANPGGDPRLKRRLTDDLRRQRVRRLKETLFTTGRVSVALPTDQTVEIGREDFLALSGVVAFAQNIRNRIRDFLREAHRSWGRVATGKGLTLVLTGGGCDLPMIRELERERWSIGGTEVGCRLAKRVPDLVAEELSAEFGQEYPQLAVALGGALPSLLDERNTQGEWLGSAPQHGPLTRYVTRGV